MNMHEIVVNLHMHTRYSDGGGSHHDIAQAALSCRVDVVIVTDHNVLVRGFEGYRKAGIQRVLLLTGEEIHDQDRDPQKNHMLVFGAERELAALADDPQTLINAVREARGLCFLAHPDDPAAPAFHETDISWIDWSVANYSGIELWNGFSELKTLIPTRIHGVFYALFPQFIAHHPTPATLRRWDELLAGGRVVAIGGSDAHANKMQLGPFRRRIFPYEFHFKAINTHVILPDPLTGDLGPDKQMLYDAMSAGHCFVGYDLPASTRGFRFTAQGRETDAMLGDEIPARGGVTLQARTPLPAEIRLVKDGKMIRLWKHQTVATHITTEPGVYRVEAYRRYLGRRRGWIFSNPIYVRS
ncbi:MAG TPA: CehA/McbA family metallohydrolase [Anaerolineales bacterium]|nr:CehA/McbA family metallohydrolase [Anaerolineales bacterium]